MTDRSASPNSLMASPAVAAEMLGRSPEWFRQNKRELVKHGFPAPCPVTKMYSKKAIRDWVERRDVTVTTTHTIRMENLDALSG